MASYFKTDILVAGEANIGGVPYVPSTVTNDTVNASRFPIFGAVGTGVETWYTNTGYRFNPSTGILSVPHVATDLTTTSTAVTQTVGDNSTKVATTAYVDSSLPTSNVVLMSLAPTSPIALGPGANVTAWDPVNNVTIGNRLSITTNPGLSRYVVVNVSPDLKDVYVNIQFQAGILNAAPIVGGITTGAEVSLSGSRTDPQLARTTMVPSANYFNGNASSTVLVPYDYKIYFEVYNDSASTDDWYFSISCTVVAVQP